MRGLRSRRGRWKHHNTHTHRGKAHRDAQKEREQHGGQGLRTRRIINNFQLQKLQAEPDIARLRGGQEIYRKTPTKNTERTGALETPLSKTPARTRHSLPQPRQCHTWSMSQGNPPDVTKRSRWNWRPGSTTPPQTSKGVAPAATNALAPRLLPLHAVCCHHPWRTATRHRPVHSKHRMPHTQQGHMWPSGHQNFPQPKTPTCAPTDGLKKKK